MLSLFYSICDLKLILTLISFICFRINAQSKLIHVSLLCLCHGSLKMSDHVWCHVSGLCPHQQTRCQWSGPLLPLHWWGRSYSSWSFSALWIQDAEKENQIKKNYWAHVFFWTLILPFLWQTKDLTTTSAPTRLSNITGLQFTSCFVDSLIV